MQIVAAPTELSRAIDLVASHLLFRQDRFVQLVEMAMRSLTQISGISFVVGLMISSGVSLAEQEIESDAGEVVLDATINAIDVENRLLTVAGPMLLTRAVAIDVRPR